MSARSLLQRLNGNDMMKACFLILIITAAVLPGCLTAQTISKKDTSTVQFINSRKFYIYKVEKGETLFSISQKFKIPQEEILQFNKDVEKDGLKVKTKLWIPAYSWKKKDSGETTQAAAANPEFITYRIGIVTTFNLPKIY